MLAEQRQDEIGVALQLRALSLSKWAPLHTVSLQAPQKSQPGAKAHMLALGVPAQENQRKGARK